MTEATANRIGETIALTTTRTMGLAKAMLAGIDANGAGKLPGPDGALIHTNHPVWVYGHLAIYPAMMLPMMGGDPSVASVPESWGELFGNGSECKHDPDGTIYPALDEVVAQFESGYQAAIERVRNTSDDVLSAQLDDERWRDAFGTNGGMASFMIHDHVMFHLGQVSAWRRMMGLGSAM